MTEYEAFVKRWTSGCGSSNCEGARRLCFARGDIPCEVLFVGEAPGEGENASGCNKFDGRPFWGPAGQLLDSIIQRAIVHCRVKNEDTGKDWQAPEVSYALTNLVLCIPRDPEKGGKAEEPLPEDIKACAPRLREFVQLCSPKLIVCVGVLARDWLDPKRVEKSIRSSSKTETFSPVVKPKECNYRDIPHVDILHPAYILRMPAAHQGLAVRRCIVTIQNAIWKYVTTPT